MSNSIDLIYSKEAIAGLKEAHVLLNKTHEDIVKISKTNLDFFGGSSPKNPSQLKNIITDFNKIEQASNKATAQLVKNKERERLAEIKLAQDREKAFAKYEQQLNREQQKLNASQNLYNKTQQQLNLVTAAYNNLAARKERYNNLSVQEEIRLNTLSKVTEKYNATLKAVDATVGKHTRNVGNYAGSFNPLSNSINQLGREMPAFANSMQTGFMAISNNLPIFFDAMGNVIAQNKELQAQGLPTKSVLSQLASSLFSFQTLLSVGVTLLTVYGKEIVNWAAALFGASDALNELNSRQKEFNNSRITGKKDAQSDILNLRKYLAVAKDVTASEDFRNEAVKNLRQSYYYYFKNLTDAKIKNGEYGNSVKELTKALERKGQIELATSLNVTNKQKLIDLDEERNKLVQLEKITETRLRNAIKNQVSAQGLATISDELNRVQTKRIKIDQEINKFQSAIIQNDKIIFRLKEQTIGLEIQEEKIRKKKLKRDDLPLFGDKLQEQQANSLLAKLEEEKRKLEELQRTVSKNNIEWKQYQKTIDFVDKTIKTLINTETGLEKSGEKVAAVLTKKGEEARKAEEAMRKLQQQTNMYFRGIQAEFLSDSGLGSLNFFMQMQDNGLTAFEELMKGADNLGEEMAITFNGITEVAQEAFAFINKQSEARFQAEFDRLAQQKEISIKYAGDSATAKEEIERQYEEKRLQIERRKAEQQKKAAIFNIIIDTAQAVVGALADQNYVGAVLFAALGAAQLAMVSSQPIPAYAEGTENHTGGAMLINDGRGSDYQETVVTPDGKAKQYKGRNILTTAPKGTKVFTSKQWNKELDDILVNAGINRSLKFDSGTTNNGMTASEMDNILGKHFSNIQTNQTVIDKNGINDFILKGGQKTIKLNSRTSFKGFSV